MRFGFLNGKRVEDIFNQNFFWTLSLILDRFGIPALRFWPEITIRQEVLSKQIYAVLKAWGMKQEHIRTTVSHIIYADIHGIDSHGVGMLLHYHRLLKAGSLTMRPQITVVHEGKTTAVIDGGGGLGHMVSDMAMKMAIRKCKDTGIGAVAVRNSGHFGSAGVYATMAAESDMIGLSTTSVKIPALVPTFGSIAMLGTNPIAFATPALGNRPFLLDMATSTVPVGKIITAWRSGRKIPKGWAQSDKGKPVRNPRRAAGYRRLTPLGGYKGYGLAAMVEILCAVLPNDYGADDVGHFFLALDPGEFRAVDAFKKDMDTMMDGLRTSKRLNPSQPVIVPGDPEYAAEIRSREQGILLPRCVIEDIRKVCRTSDVPFMLKITP